MTIPDRWSIGSRTTTNYAANPSFELGDANSDGIGNNWLADNSITGTPTYSLPAGRSGSCAQRIQYTGVAGDTGFRDIRFCPSALTAVGTIAEGDDVTASAYLKGALAGCTCRLVIRWWDYAGYYLGSEIGSAVSISGSWARGDVTGTAPATASRFDFYVQVLDITEADTVDLYIDDVLAEKGSTASTYPGDLASDSPVAINYHQNPSFETDTDSDGRADGVGTFVDGTTTGTAVLSQIAGRLGGYAQRVVYTGVAGDSAGKTLQGGLHSKTDAGTFVPGDPVIGSAYIKGACSGTGLRFVLLYHTDAGAYVTSAASGELSVGADWARVSWAGTVPATAGRVTLSAASTFGTIVESDVFDVAFDDVVLEKAAAVTDYFDGESLNCYFGGDWHASLSYRELCRAEDGTVVVGDTVEANDSRVHTPGMSVVGGRTYGAALNLEVTARAGGTCTADLDWYASDDTYISSTEIKALSAITADARYAAVGAAPAAAAYARVSVAWSGATGACEAIVYDVDSGAHLISLPATIVLSAMHGQHEAPLELVLAGTDLHHVAAGVYPDETAVVADFIHEAVDLSWSAGVAAADANGYPDGAGNTVWKTNSASAIYADIDVTGYEPGTYAVYANASRDAAASPAQVYTAYTDEVDIEGTDLRRHLLGYVSLPCETVRGSATSSLRVYLISDGTDYVYLNTVELIPASWGITGWHHGTSSESADELRFADGIVYADDTASLAYATGDRELAALGGALVVTGEAEVEAATVSAEVAIEYAPRWEQLPS